MNTTKSWFQKARARTLGNNNCAQENKASNDACQPDHQDGQRDSTTAPSAAKSSTGLIDKPATANRPSSTVPEVVNNYNLKWEELEPVLKQIYPGVGFKENLVTESHYMIYVPRPLTCGERDKINEIREKNIAREESAAQLPA
ncbi:hypothetical protein GGR51DRAFT_497775 [Nemania sp. FL0031]|nr:hypothetical protein GGR51DRAFT_497775 [Nemania sp. FL0031]